MFDQLLPCVTFERIQAVFVEMTASLQDPHALVTEAEATVPGVERFSVLVSLGFSALLQGTLTPEGEHYQAQLVVEPVVIATFLEILPSPSIDRLLALQNRRANRAKLQSQFSTRVLQAMVVDLAPAASAAVACQPVVDAALHHQLAQEHLVHQITNQIQQSLELPLILKTAVENVRASLQADRLVIHQFIDLTETGGTDSEQGCITYEALSSGGISSVLSMEKTAGWGNVYARHAQHHGEILVIDDVAEHYKARPLKVLQTLKVQSEMVTPIVVHGQIWGLLIAHQCSEPRHWQKYEKSLLQLIGENLAIAIYQTQLYRQLQQQKQTLEDQVAQRTHELHQAFIDLQSANQAKSEFLATMSHELRTPLTCVIGMSATLLRWSLGPLSEKQKSYLQRIHDSGEHLLELINDILDFSHVESGKASLALREFSLSSLTQQSLHMVREQAQNRNVHLKMSVKVLPDQDHFTADSRRVKQILFVLLDNAIKFTPANGDVTLRVWVESQTAVFQVEDTGIGIPIDQQSQLFQSFHQLDPSYHRTHEGTGLGLAMAKKFIDLHQGWIKVSSVEGQGSVFTVELPNQALRPRLASEPVVSSARGRRVILVEEDEETADLMCDMLTAAGYQVIWTVEVSTAVKQTHLLNPEVVIIDIAQSAQDRLTMIRQLRQRSDVAPIHILVMVPSDHDESKTKLANVDAYLTKPVDPQYLVHRIDRLLMHDVETTV